jgi:hypothetical protein
MRPPVLAALAAASLACASTAARAPYALQHGPGVILSNSPMLDARSRPVRRAGRLEVAYAVLVLNRSGGPLTIRPEDVSAQVDTRVAEAHCRRSGAGEGAQELPAQIGPGMEVRLDCTLRLPDEATALVAAGDRTLKMEISLPDLDGAQFPFEYFLRVEDAR